LFIGVSAGSFSIDIDNQSAGNYQYDANGNVTQDASNGTGFIVYDINNLPITEYKTDGTVITYCYDANGNRVQKTVDSTPTYYVLGADGKTDAITFSDTTKAIYNLFGNDNFGQVKKDGSTLARYYYLKDHLGSIKMIVDASGNMDSYNDYYPFGMLMDKRTGAASADARYKFTGKERDAETGFDYFGARYYDSRIGRFNSIDRFADKYPGMSPYGYAAGNPTSIIDPSGDTVVSINVDLEKKMMEQMNNEDKKQYESYKTSSNIYEFWEVQLGYEIITEARKYIDKLTYSENGEANLDKSADCSGFDWAVMKKLGYTGERFVTGNILQNKNFKEVQNQIWGDIALTGRHMGFFDPTPISPSPSKQGGPFFQGGTYLSARSSYGYVQYGLTKWYGQPTYLRVK